MVRRLCWFAVAAWAPALLLGCSDGTGGEGLAAPPPESCRDYRPPPPTDFPAVRPDLLIPLPGGHDTVGDGAAGLWMVNLPAAGTADRLLVRIDSFGNRSDQVIGSLPDRVQFARGDTTSPWAHFAIERPITVGGRPLEPSEARVAVVGFGPGGVTVPPVLLQCAGPSKGSGCFSYPPTIINAAHLRDGVALLVRSIDAFQIAGTTVPTSSELQTALVVLDAAGAVRAARTVGAGLEVRQVVAQDDGRLTVWGTIPGPAHRGLAVESYPLSLADFTRHELGGAGLRDIHGAPGPGATLWFAGAFEGTVTAGNQQATNGYNSSDIAVLGVRPASGEPLGLFAFGGPGAETVLDLKADARGRLWLAGTAMRRLTVGDAELDLGTAYRGHRAFVARLDGSKLGALAVVSQTGNDSQPDTLPHAIFPLFDDRVWMLSTSTLARSGGDRGRPASPWYHLSRVPLGTSWGPRMPAGPPLDDPGARPLAADELLLAHPDELHAAGGVLVVGGQEPLAAARLERTGGRWHTTATIPGPTPTCQVETRLATDGQVLVRTTAPGRFCRDKVGQGFTVHERAPDGQFVPVTLPRKPHESEWFEGAAVASGVLALGAVPWGFSDTHQIEFFHRGPAGWTAGQVLAPPTPCPNIFIDCWGGFGRQLLLDRQRLLLGADGADHSRPTSGKILVYQAGRDGFALSQTVVAHDAAPKHSMQVHGGEGAVSWIEARGEGFGHTLAAAGGLVVTVPIDKDATYLLKDGGRTLEDRGQLPLDTLEGDIDPDAHTLALSRDFLVVGNPWESGLTGTAGAVYIYRRDGDRWRRLRALTLTDPWRSARLGAGLAIHEDRWLLIAAPGQGPAGAVFEVDLVKLAQEARPDTWSCR